MNKHSAFLRVQVVVLRLRPAFPLGSCPGYVNLARSCWRHEPSNRPTFEDVVSELKTLLAL